MKTIFSLAFLFILSNNFAQSKDANIDPKFVGSWTGSEKDQQQLGLEKHWIMHRFNDGMFILLYTTVRDGEVSSHAEKGKWWIENNEFHELHFVSGMTDIYTYTFLDDNNIMFKSKVVIESTQESYEFLDTKLIDN